MLEFVPKCNPPPTLLSGHYCNCCHSNQSTALFTYVGVSCVFGVIYPVFAGCNIDHVHLYSFNVYLTLPLFSA